MTIAKKDSKKAPESRLKTIYVPKDKDGIFKTVNEMTSTLDISLSAAIVQGLELWIRESRSGYYKKLRDGVIADIEIFEKALHGNDTILSDENKRIHRVNLESARFRLHWIDEKISKDKSLTKDYMESAFEKLIDVIVAQFPDLLIEKIWESDLIGELSKQIEENRGEY
jgi:hypothetical protein